MTKMQDHAINASIRSARDMIKTLREQAGITMHPQVEVILIIAVATGQVAASREVAQFNANERAEIARLGTDEIIDQITELATK